MCVFSPALFLVPRFANYLYPLSFYVILSGKGRKRKTENGAHIKKNPWICARMSNVSFFQYPCAIVETSALTLLFLSHALSADGGRAWKTVCGRREATLLFLIFRAAKSQSLQRWCEKIKLSGQNSSFATFVWATKTLSYGKRKGEPDQNLQISLLSSRKMPLMLYFEIVRLQKQVCYLKKNGHYRSLLSLLLLSLLVFHSDIHTQFGLAVRSN